jgi:hypothetical protein
MPDARVPIFRTALMSWRDGFAALAAMPVVALGTFAAMLFSQMTADAVSIITAADGAWQWQLLRPVLALLYSYLAAPGGIAVSRHVLLGEATRRYDLDPAQLRLRRYFFYSAIIELLITASMVSAESIAISDDDDWTALEFLFGLSAGIFLLAIVLLSVFMAILFPAVAIDAPGANFRNAVRDTHFWRTLLAALLILLPVVIALLPSILLYNFEDGFSQRWVMLSFYDSVITTLALAAVAALGSQLYQAWGNKLNQPADAATER